MVSVLFIRLHYQSQMLRLLFLMTWLCLSTFTQFPQLSILPQGQSGSLFHMGSNQR